MIEIKDIFACLPSCQFSQLGLYEWLVIILFFVFVFLISKLAIKLIFNSYKNKQDSIKWHIPRFLFITFVVSFVTTAPIVLMFGFDIVRLYIKVLPFICIIIYLLWLFNNDNQKT